MGQILTSVVFHVCDLEDVLRDLDVAASGSRAKKLWTIVGTVFDPRGQLGKHVSLLLLHG